MKKYGFMVLSIIIFTVFSFIFLTILAWPGFNLWLILCVILMLLGFVISVPLAIILHELGHCVFGLKNGYELVCFKFAFWEVSKNEKGKYKLKKTATQAGILGQCLMAPPKNVKKMATKIKKFNHYNAGGLVFSYGLIVLNILLFIIPSNPLRWFLIPQIVVNFFLALNNSIYLPNGVNDVCNYLIVKKNNNYVDSICYQLEIVSNLYAGKRLGAKTKYEPYYEDKLNHISLAAVQFKFYYYVDHKDYEKAMELIDLVNRNYYNIQFPVQKLAVTFDILWADLCLHHNKYYFKRHFNRLTSLELKFIKPNTDLEAYYKMYEKINNKDYNIHDDIVELIACEDGFSGEALSLKDRLIFLENTLKIMEEGDN